MSPYRVDARLSGRHPFELYLLYLTMATSLPTLLGITPRPGTITHAMPPWLAFCWSLTLALGAVAALLGIYLPRRDTGLIMEQLGLTLIGIAGVTYTILALYENGIDSLIPVAIIGGYGASCLVRAKQIQDVFRGIVGSQNERGSRS